MRRLSPTKHAITAAVAALSDPDATVMAK